MIIYISSLSGLCGKGKSTPGCQLSARYARFGERAVVNYIGTASVAQLPNG